MTIRMYDLAGAEDGRRFSPFCWRIKMALSHKGVPFETIAWRFGEKSALEGVGSKTVPVIVDGATVVADSWKIALYLDEAYPGTVRLMDSEQSRGAILAFKFWVERTVQAGMLPVVILDLLGNIHPNDRAYFRESREKRFGKTLEAFGADPEGAIGRLRQALDPARALLSEQNFVGGRTPSFADDILFGAFQWGRCVSPKHLLATDDPIYRWRERMLDMHDGVGRQGLGYPV